VKKSFDPVPYSTRSRSAPPAAIRAAARPSSPQAHLHPAAAHVSMAVEAMAREPDPAVSDNMFRRDVECDFELVLRQAQDDREG